MAKTYPALTDVATGDVLTADAYNGLLTNVRNVRVPPMCRIVRTTGQSVVKDTWAFVDTWSDTATGAYDTDSMWTTPNNYVEIPVAGAYLVQYGGAWTGNTSGDRMAGINVNTTTVGTALIHTAHVRGLSVTGFEAAVVGNFTYSFSAGDAVRMQVRHNSTTDPLVFGTAAGGFAYLSLAWLGQVA